MKDVFFFGRLSGLTAQSPATPMASDAFRAQLAATYPELADARVRMAVNQTLVQEPVMVGPDDEIAFLPPTSGG